MLFPAIAWMGFPTNFLLSPSPFFHLENLPCFSLFIEFERHSIKYERKLSRWLSRPFPFLHPNTTKKLPPATPPLRLPPTHLIRRFACFTFRTPVRG
nr:hypothetical protein Q903MT_gene2768 [Picea sitchensis]